MKNAGYENDGPVYGPTGPDISMNIILIELQFSDNGYDIKLYLIRLFLLYRWWG